MKVQISSCPDCRATTVASSSPSSSLSVWVCVVIGEGLVVRGPKKGKIDDASDIGSEEEYDDEEDVRDRERDIGIRSRRTWLECVIVVIGRLLLSLKLEECDLGGRGS